MMEKQDGASRSRLRIVDTTGPDYSSQINVKRRRRPQKPQKQHFQQRQEQDIPSHIPQWPLETLVIQRAVLEYGRRTAALGAQHGAQALKSLVSKIRELGPPTPALAQIMTEADDEAARLRMMLHEVYEE
jgi:hypothetical protein